MSPLPQRKKSAEEIAKLREELGISGEAPPPPDFKNETPPAPPPPPGKAAAQREAPAASPEPEKPPEIPAPDPLPAPAAGPPAEIAALPPPKPVRSLKKSERLPIEPRPRTQASSEGKIPAKRRSDQDIAEIRRREALAMQGQPPLFAPLLAHPAILAAGYILAIAGGIFAWRDLHFAWMATSEAIALAVAAFIFFKKTLSLHHAGFIAILAIFISIFAALHYFPQLQNAP